MLPPINVFDGRTERATVAVAVPSIRSFPQARDSRREHAAAITRCESDANKSAQTRIC